jgi:hypothetical protein
MQSKRRDLLPSLCLLILLGLLVLTFFVLARQSVEVRVYDAHTGALLPHAIVENLTPAQRQRTLAGWLFLDVNRRLSVSADAAGYLPAQASWYAPYPWILQGRLDIHLSAGQLTGVVRDVETGLPLPGTEVWIGAEKLATDASGKFHLLFPAGDVSVSVQLDGYQPWQREVGRESPLLAGEFLTIDLWPNLVVGRVYWQETGEPLPGAMVTVAGQQWVTDQRGGFGLRRLRVGDTLTVEREGFWPDQVTHVGQPLDIALRDRRVWVVVSSALENVVLSDLKVTRNGQPLAAQSPGVFELRVCKTGELLEVTASGHQPAQAHLGAPGGWDVGEVEEIEMVLQPRTLTVTVRDDYTGWPLRGALVSSSPPRPTNDQGWVTLEPAVPGMAITVEYPGYISQTLHDDGQASRLEVRLVPHTIQGLVVDADTGRPVPGAALRQDGQTLTQTAADGSFCLEGLRERSAFTVRLPGYRLARVVIGNHASPVAPRLCSRDAGNSSICWEIRLTPLQVRGVYIPFGLLYSRQRTLAVLDMIANTELNAVVVDVKGDRGRLAYVSDLPLAVELGVSASGIMDIREFLGICRRRGIYTIARLVVFKDNPLAHGKPELAVKRADGSIWLDRENLGWANPFREEVWDYNIGLAREVAQLGFDEVQLDYVRFPSDGELAKILYEEENTPETRTTAIRTFVSRMREALSPYDVFLSADVFGLTLVVNPQTGMGIGQRVIDIAPYVDYLCPMVYPSTFIPGNLGMANPALHPYEVVTQSLLRGMTLTSTLMRPWLQAYSFDGVEYGLARQNAQRRAAEKVGASGWTFWNASGRYDARLFYWRIVANAKRLEDGGRQVQ